jgi:S1-C subfamily serine protease
LIVKYVDSESPAKRFEIRKYDVLTHFKDQALVNPAQLGALIEESVKDEEIPIRYLREGKQGTLSVRLSDRERIF